MPSQYLCIPLFGHVLLYQIKQFHQSHGRDSVYIGCYNADNRGWDELLADFEEQVGIKYNGRPHWGKEFNVGTDYFRSVYAKWDDFLKLRSEMDANGRFMNSMLDGLFGFKQTMI